MHPFVSILLFLACSLAFLLGSVLFLFYCERKLSAFMQDRMGPTHVGKVGLLQPAADLLKLLTKETIVPTLSRKGLFLLAPLLIFGAVFSGFALLPLWQEWFEIPQLPGGLLLLLGLVSVEAIGLLMAAYSSRSKFPLIGASRAVAQMISYEIPLGIAVLGMSWAVGSITLEDFQALQVSVDSPLGMFPGLRANGGIFSWNLIQFPASLLLIPVFYLCILAESNRAPFDIPEGESEIIGGFHTEYSGFLWAIFFLAEYAMMLLLSLVMVYLFFGGAASPLPSFGLHGIWNQPSFFWLLVKSWTLGLSMIWIRWTLPRLRVDQLMGLGWKVLTPMALAGFLLLVLFN